jgi:hypothetical protein
MDQNELSKNNNMQYGPPKEFLEWHKEFLNSLISDGPNGPFDFNTLQIALKETEEALENSQDT